MEIILVDRPIARQRLKEIGEPQFGTYVKAVVDVNKGIMAVGGDFHADEESFFLDRDMKLIHSSLAGGRWFTMSIAEQMANVGSEYERALRWKERGNTGYFEHALDRMLELFDLTIEDPRWRNHRLRELCRVREIVRDQLCSENPEPWSRADFKDYFLAFGILARNERDRALEASALKAKR